MQKAPRKVTLGTALTKSASKILLLGSGELGKELTIEAQRLGVQVVAVDRYAHAPAMHVAHSSHVIDMLDADALRAIIELEKPDYIVPEIEAINTNLLMDLEKEGFNVVPSALATRLTMDREGIRRLASEQLKLSTTQYLFAETKEEYMQAAMRIGLPFVIKPIMSSSGKGQSLVKTPQAIEKAWNDAQAHGRVKNAKVILESFVDFDYEITLLTVRHVLGTTFCAPIGHHQEGGDYQQSWQPQPMSTRALQRAQAMAAQITDALGGYGVFGVEFFVKNEEVIFSEVSPRPHDTGMVTLISQDLSEFALHVRAILGLPIPGVRQLGYAASSAVVLQGHSQAPRFSGIETALSEPDVQLRLFAKPEINGARRMGVVLALADSLESAVAKATTAANLISLEK